MSAPVSPDAHDRSDDTSRLPRLFVLIVLVEAITIAALYWFGRHFGPA
ncbi:MAG TPA: hypothetical protein VHB78_00980 [Vicinamibacterales bacterium]|jgi:hypothetical protein|nr:hypothetical protein [Vicinamibacterales bacterium]